MYMDFSSSSSYYYQEDEKWVGFSASNINRLHMSSSCSHSSHPLCIFNNSPGGGGINGVEEDSRRATDLSIITCGSPTLEDFLGGCANSGSSAAPATQVFQLSDGSQTNFYDDSTDQHYLYDSKLTTINAASFLPDFSAQQTQTPKQLKTVASLPPKKAVDFYGHRTSIYRGVTRHRWTGRYEAHLWDNTCIREGQSRKGRQVYLGGYDKEEKAARAYDLAALKYWGPTTTTNFPVCNYEKELEDMKNMTRQEFVASLRRKSSGFSRGASIYRGVTRHHQHGRWQARIGRVAGNKDLYLGTFSTQEEAAEAYDIAAIRFRGLNAVTNFDMSRYNVESIASSNLPVGSKTSPDDQSEGNYSNNKSIDWGSPSDGRDLSTSSSITFALQPVEQDPSGYWPMLEYNQQNSYSSNSTQNPGYNSTSGLFQGTSTPVSTLIETNNNSDGILGGTSNIQQQTSSIPFTTPIALNSNNNSNYYDGGEGYGNIGNWIAAPCISSLQNSFQTAKN